MAAIYKELKLLEEKLNAGIIREDDVVEEFIKIWENAKTTGDERRCAIKFIRDNINDSNNSDALTLIISIK